MSTSIDIGLIQFFLCFVRFESICLNEVHDIHVPITGIKFLTGKMYSECNSVEEKKQMSHTE